VADSAPSEGGKVAEGTTPGGTKYRITLADHRKRALRAWSDRDLWQKFYDDAYEFVIPFRQPAARRGKAQQKIDRLFDATAVESAFRAAGQLHADLFPPDFFKLAPGAVSKVAMEKPALEEMEKGLETIGNIVNAFFQTGEFDTASSEMCIDLLVGTGALFPVEGDADNPVRFVCIPFDELAIEVDAYGKVVAIYWKSMLTRRQIKAAFPNGKFPDSFVRADNSPDEEIEICQDFVFDPDKKDWIFCAYVADSEAPIVETAYRTQPMAVPRYHRVPGEAYGRGPILLALPTIKTLNKAVELTLKSAAIQMLGIWGYRPGAFNPDTARLGPGEFWPMQSTSGVLGPDVHRLDTSSGKVDVGQLISQELRLQVQSMLGDDRLPDKGATPVSATEIMARMKRIAQNYMGAWARVVNEVHPVIVRRVIEILARRKIPGVPDLDINTLLVKVDVLSPITAAIKAAGQSRIIDFIQLVIALKGSPMAAEMIVKVDDALRHIGKEQIPASLLMTVTEQQRLEGLIQAAVAQYAAAQAKQQQPQPGAAA
jgi:hypothetical protein